MRLREGLTVLWRNQNEVQVGVDPEHRVILSAVTETRLRALLDFAAGNLTPHLVRRRVPQEYLAALQEADMLEPASTLRTVPESAPPPAAQATPELAAYARAGLTWPGLASRQNKNVAVVGSGLFLARVAECLALAGYGEVQLASHLYSEKLPIVPCPHLYVLDGDAWLERHDLAIVGGQHVIAPWLTQRLLAHDTPHLVITMKERAVAIGPLVVPGWGACTRCIHLHETARDPAWPALATQLVAAVEQPVPAIATARATSLAALAATAWLDRADPTFISRQLVVPFSPAAPSFTEVAPHPECGCGAAASPHTPWATTGS